MFRMWQGKQLYYMGGKIQFGINLFQPIITFITINALQILLISFTIKDLEKIRPGMKNVRVFSIIVQFVTSVLLFITASKDPATIPMRKFLLKAFESNLD